MLAIISLTICSVILCNECWKEFKTHYRKRKKHKRDRSRKRSRSNNSDST